MKDKKGLLIGLVLTVTIILLGVFMGFKLYLINHYGAKSLDYTFEEISNAYKISNKIKVHTKILDNTDYLEYQEIKIRNDFKDYESQENNDVTGNYVVYTNKEKESYFSLGITEPYFDFLHLNDNSKDYIIKNVTYKEVSAYLKKNNVTSDLELFAFLASDNYQKNVFSKSHDIKASYALYNIASIINPQNKKITLLEGDLNGYMFIQDNNVYEVNILKNNKRYVFVITGYTEDKLMDLINTIIISDK